MFAIGINPTPALRYSNAVQNGDQNGPALVVALKALLRATRVIEGHYQKAIWRTRAICCAPLKGLFEQHHAEQRDLEHVLEDRLLTLGGSACAISSGFIYETQFRAALVRRALPLGLLEGLRDNHEWILRAAAPSHRLIAGVTSWAKDLAVGRVVLSNDLQRAALLDELRCRDPFYRFSHDSDLQET
jgi:hypothetical protein